MIEIPSMLFPSSLFKSSPVLHDSQDGMFLSLFPENLFWMLYSKTGL